MEGIKIEEPVIEQSPKIVFDEIYSLTDQIENLPENRRIDPNDFRGIKKVVNGVETDELLFPDSVIDHDLEAVEKKNVMILNEKKKLSEFQINRDKIGKFLEVAIPDAINKLGWLGDDVKIKNTSYFEDYEKGIDKFAQTSINDVVKGEEDLKCLGFSIDFTISERSAGEKIKDVSVSLARDHVPVIKYFSADIKTKEGIKNLKLRDFEIAKIIISCPADIIEKYKDDLIDYEKNPNDEKLREKAKNSVLKYYFIRECLSQLEFFSELSGMLGNKKAQKVYRDSFKVFKKIFIKLGIDYDILDEKLAGIPGLIGDFDLYADNKAYIKMINELK